MLGQGVFDHEIEQRRKEFACGQIAGPAEDDDGERVVAALEEALHGSFGLDMGCYGRRWLHGGIPLLAIVEDMGGRLAGGVSIPDGLTIRQATGRWQPGEIGGR
jgi:hypothetical protein